jgi:hypothetical protein
MATGNHRRPTVVNRWAGTSSRPEKDDCNRRRLERSGTWREVRRGLAMQRAVRCYCWLVIYAFWLPEPVQDGKSVGYVTVMPKTIRKLSGSIENRLEEAQAMSW